MAHALITPDDIKQGSKGAFGPDFDYLLDKIIIPAVGKLFAHYCHRDDFDKSERSEYLSPRAGQTFLTLKSPPIAASPAVQLWQNCDLPRAYTSADLLVNGTDYFVHEDEGVIEMVGSFGGGPKTVKCTYTGGYLTAAGVGTPDDIRLAAVAQAKIIFDRREELGVTSRSQEGGSVTMLSLLTLPRAVTMILDPYRLLKA